VSTYESEIKGKSAEELLAHPLIRGGTDQDYYTYLRVAAQVRTNQELMEELKRASTAHAKANEQLVAELRTASEAQVQSTSRLIQALQQASSDSGRIAVYVFRLTFVIAIAAVC
jgi:hypothetical protein